MWISAENRPDLRTINCFRGEVMKGIIGLLFASLLELLMEEGCMKLEDHFLEGTKIEANANKYKWVWAKNTRRYKGQLQEKVKSILEEAERLNEEEDREYGDRGLEEMGEEGPIDGEKLEKKIEGLDVLLKEKPEDKKLAKAVEELKEDCLPRQKKYEEQERTLGERNSYAKTEPYATFMRMKGDPEGMAQPKAAYNVQLGTEG
jgi:hypothetical protein